MGKLSEGCFTGAQPMHGNVAVGDIALSAKELLAGIKVLETRLEAAEAALKHERETQRTYYDAVGAHAKAAEKLARVREWAERNLDKPGWRRDELLAILDD